MNEVNAVNVVNGDKATRKLKAAAPPNTTSLPSQLTWAEVFRSDDSTQFCPLCGSLLDVPDSGPKMICDLCGNSIDLLSIIFRFEALISSLFIRTRRKRISYDKENGFR